MDDDTDLMIAAAATAAVFTWMGMRNRERGRGTVGRTDWRPRLQRARAGLSRCWRDTPGYLFITGIRDALFRKR